MKEWIVSGWIHFLIGCGLGWYVKGHAVAIWSVIKPKIGL